LSRLSGLPDSAESFRIAPETHPSRRRWHLSERGRLRGIFLGWKTRRGGWWRDLTDGKQVGSLHSPVDLNSQPRYQLKTYHYREEEQQAHYDEPQRGQRGKGPQRT